MRFYFSEFTGAGTDADPFYPAAWDSVQLQYLDGREYPEIEDGWCICWGTPSGLEHTALLADGLVVYLPLEDGVGDVVPLDNVITEVTTANRAIVTGYLEDRHIPTDGITGATTVREALKLIFKRIRIRERLLYVDFVTMLFTATVGDIPALKRKALKRRLTNEGIDVSGLTNTTTIKDALLLLLPQITQTPID